MEIPIPTCPPIPPSVCLPGFSAHSCFHYYARSRLFPPGLPVWSASSGHALTPRLSINLFVSLLFYELQLVIPHTISSAYYFPVTLFFSLPPCSSYLSVLLVHRLFTIWLLMQSQYPTPPPSSSAKFHSLPTHHFLKHPAVGEFLSS